MQRKQPSRDARRRAAPKIKKPPASPDAAPTKWRNRITSHALADPKTLIANEANWRKHPAEQQAAMDGALAELGWLQSVIVNRRNMHIIDGHLRVELALKERETQVPVCFVDLSDDEERKALATIDPLSALAETDAVKLSALLGQVQATDLGMRSLLDQLAKQAKGILEQEAQGLAPDDGAPAPPVGRPVTRSGELWHLGEHRLIVGDSTLPAVISRLMTGRPARLLLTDPPYNIGYEGAAGTIANDDLQAKQFATFLRLSFEASAAHLEPGGAFYVFHSDTETIAFRQALATAGLGVRQGLVWAKNAATLSRSDYNWRHEAILYGWKPGAAHYFAFNFTETTVVDQADNLGKLGVKELRELVVQLLRREATTSVIYEDKPIRSIEHPTMKPVALLTRLMANSTRRGEVVLDPFGGSGSTLIAAEKLGRKARLCELEPKFADVIIRRWQDWTGHQAHEADSQHSFAEHAAQITAEAA